MTQIDSSQCVNVHSCQWIRWNGDSSCIGYKGSCLVFTGQFLINVLKMEEGQETSQQVRGWPCMQLSLVGSPALYLVP